jgi:hypothetical protein
MMGLVGARSLVCMWSGACAWPVMLNGSADRADVANAVTVDAAGDVLAAGWTPYTSTRFLPRCLVPGCDGMGRR